MSAAGSLGSVRFQASTSAAATVFACGVSAQPPSIANTPLLSTRLPRPAESLVPRPNTELVISLVRASTTLSSTTASFLLYWPPMPPITSPNTPPSTPLLWPICSANTISARRM
ncbi:hypothetical protein X551_04122 [Methylibium sp. T29]|nr:hypothetical protein X551_04122 [Methylibium sp. T29]